MAPARIGPASTIRGALTAGFAVVFVLWVASGYELVRSLRDVDRRLEASRDDFQRGQDVLTTVRTNVLLGSIYLRDALIDRTPASHEDYRTALLTDPRRRGPRAAGLPAAHRLAARAAALGQPPGGAGATTGSRATWCSSPTGRCTTANAAAVLRQRIVPARQSILEIVDSLSALQRASRERHEAEAALLYSNAQTRVVSLASLAIVVGLVVAVRGHAPRRPARARDRAAAGRRTAEPARPRAAVGPARRPRRKRSAAASRASCTTRSGRR